MGLREIFTSTEGYLGPFQAPLYGIEDAPESLTWMDLGSERTGYFAQVPFLLLMGSRSSSDAIQRGLSLAYRMLCVSLPPGDPGRPPLPPPDLNWTDRDLVEAYTGRGTCGEDCHTGTINPLGFAFEHFDGLGRYREVDGYLPINAAAAYPFGSGRNTMVGFDGAVELMSIISESPAAHACFAKNLSGYALARQIVSDDVELLIQLAEVSRVDDGSIKDVFRELVQTPSFHTRPLTG